MSDNSNNEYEDDDHQEDETTPDTKLGFQLPIDDDSGDDNLEEDGQNDNVNLEIDVENQHDDNQIEQEEEEIQNDQMNLLGHEIDEDEMQAYQDQDDQMQQDMLVQRQMYPQEIPHGYINFGQQYQEMVHPQILSKRPITGSRQQKFLSDEQQKHVLRKAMILDKADRRKTENDLKMEIEELKKMRNKDVADIKMLKVELNKMEILYKKYKESGGFSSQNPIQLPDAYINSNQYHDPDQGIIDTAMLLDDMNFVKNQLQCELLKMKANTVSQSKVDNFFKQRHITISDNATNNWGSTQNKLPSQSGSFQNQSSIRLQINTLKSKCKLLQESIVKKDMEIAKIKAKNGTQNVGMEEKTKNELKRAHTILKQLKKRLRQNQIYNGQKNPVNLYEQEYNQIMSQIQNVLGMTKKGGGVVAVQENEEYEIVNDDDEGYMEAQNPDNQQDQPDQNENEGNSPQRSPGQADLCPNEDQTLNDLRQKIQDLKAELEMSPRQFEDKLLHKLREEIIISKQQMQEQLQAEIEIERQRIQNQNKGSTKRKEDLQAANRHLQNEVTRLKNVLKKSPQSNKSKSKM